VNGTCLSFGCFLKKFCDCVPAVFSFDEEYVSCESNFSENSEKVYVNLFFVIMFKITHSAFKSMSLYDFPFFSNLFKNLA
jgi:hypothetical protein